MGNSIDQEVCIKCKFCIEVCPCKIIGINDRDEVYFIQGRESICQQCGQCMAVCSTKAVLIEGLSYEKDLFDLPVNSIGYNDFIYFLSNRRSVRNYKDKSIPPGVINQILESISYAPYGAEPHKVSITVINNRTRIESALPHIAGFLDNIVKWMEHPVISRIIKRRNSIEKFNTIRNHLYPIARMGNYKLEFGDRITRGAPALIIFHAESGAEEHTDNSLIYATYAMLTALSLGLGAAMNSIVAAAVNKVPEVKEIFEIPEDHEAIVSVILGYPKYKYKRAIKRPYQKINVIN